MDIYIAHALLVDRYNTEHLWGKPEQHNLGIYDNLTWYGAKKDVHMHMYGYIHCSSLVMECN